MNRSYVSSFDVRQVMQQDDFEIYHRFDTASGFIAPHSHDFYELYIPRTDGVSYTVDDHRYHLKPGMLMVVAPGQTHWSNVSERGLAVERFVLWLNPSFVESLTGLLPRFRRLQADDLRGRNLLVPDAETYELMLELLISLLREKQLNDLDSASLNRLVVAQLLIHISRVLSDAPGRLSGRASQRHREIVQIYEYISAHLSEQMSVTSLAERFFMDKNTLTRQFRHVTGMTPAECIRRKRLDAAHTMISHGAGMTEACQECGFSDYSSFYRAFRKVYGKSPSASAAQSRDSVHLSLREEQPEPTSGI